MNSDSSEKVGLLGSIEGKRIAVRQGYGHYDSDSQDTSRSHEHYRRYGAIDTARDVNKSEGRYGYGGLDSESIISSADEGYGARYQTHYQGSDVDAALSSAEEGDILTSMRDIGYIHHTTDKSMEGKSSLSSPWRSESSKIKQKEANKDKDGGSSSDEFDNYQLFYNMIKTGRQRKKFSARSRGGEFMLKRKKRRVYFCCIGNEIDVEGLHDHFFNGHLNMYGKLYIDVLYLYEKRDSEKVTTQPILNVQGRNELERLDDRNLDSDLSISPKDQQGGFSMNEYDIRRSRSYTESYIKPNSTTEESSTSLDKKIDISKRRSMSVEYEPKRSDSHDDNLREQPIDSAAKLWQVSGKEIYVFNFGAVVFWGYPRGEEAAMLAEIRKFIVKGELDSMEFNRCEDDMAFVVSPTETSITIANDVISCPGDVDIKSRLAVSFAIAQSAVLALFEGRIDGKVQEYKYIPENLAMSGRVKLPQKKLGNMIGDVLAIRHDVNLNTEIMSTPDFFWREDDAVVIYRMTMKYLEMENRTEVLNTRLNMLKDLLVVLQQQSESVLAVQLEWIVIWLIVVSIVLEILSVLGHAIT